MAACYGGGTAAGSARTVATAQGPTALPQTPCQGASSWCGPPLRLRCPHVAHRGGPGAAQPDPRRRHARPGTGLGGGAGIARPDRPHGGSPPAPAGRGGRARHGTAALGGRSRLRGGAPRATCAASRRRRHDRRAGGPRRGATGRDGGVRPCPPAVAAHPAHRHRRPSGGVRASLPPRHLRRRRCGAARRAALRPDPLGWGRDPGCGRRPGGRRTGGGRFDACAHRGAHRRRAHRRRERCAWARARSADPLGAAHDVVRTARSIAHLVGPPGGSPSPLFVGRGIERSIDVLEVPLPAMLAARERLRGDAQRRVPGGGRWGASGLPPVVRRRPGPGAGDHAGEHPALG